VTQNHLTIKIEPADTWGKLKAEEKNPYLEKRSAQFQAGLLAYTNRVRLRGAVRVMSNQ
jgi:hypothetical protein